MVQMNFIFIFISSSDTNLMRKKSVKQKIKNDGLRFCFQSFSTIDDEQTPFCTSDTIVDEVAVGHVYCQQLFDNNLLMDDLVSVI